jgi:hypothetical protein
MLLVYSMFIVKNDELQKINELERENDELKEIMNNLILISKNIIEIKPYINKQEINKSNKYNDNNDSEYCSCYACRNYTELIDNLIRDKKFI